MIERVVIAGGGTGGHLFPGVAVVEELRRRNPNVDVMFVGTERGIENRVLPASGEKLSLLDVGPLKGQSAAQTMANMARLPMSAGQAFHVLRQHRPQLVIGLGGYAAGPVLAAAAAMRIPTALLEQNAHVGMTNRMLAQVVGRAYLTYEETVPVFGERRARLLGNPVRRDFVEAAQLASLDPIGAEARERKLLVLGGSQGARCLNELVPEALAQAGVQGSGLTVLHQTGAAMVNQVRVRYAELGIDAEVVPFIHDMARVYASAGLIIARAGATTLSELCAIGRPSVLIPFPFAAADHQMKNARALERKGAAVALPEAGLTAEALAQVVAELVGDPERRRAMAEAARDEGRPDAAAAIVDDLYEWLGMASASTDSAHSNASAAVAPPAQRDRGTENQRTNLTRRPKVRRNQLRIRPLEEFAHAAR